MVVVSSFDITRVAAAWRLMRSIAGGLLALAVLAWSGAAPAEHRPAAWTSTLAAAAAPATVSREVPAGQAQHPGARHPDALPGLDWDEPGEDPLKLGRALKAAPPARPSGAPIRRADHRPDGIAASLPERPPRA